MKKGFAKRALLISMVLTLAFGLFGCGKKKDDDMANAALAKENVYKIQEIALPEFYKSGNGSMDMRASAVVNDKVYMIFRVYDWENYSEEEDLRLISMNKDGSNVKVVQIEVPKADPLVKEDATTLPEGTVPEESEPVEIMPRDEAATEKVPAEDEDAATDDYISDDTDIKYPTYGNTYDSTNYENFFFTADGNICGMKMVTHEDWENPENNQGKCYLVKWNTEGKISEETEIEGLNLYNYEENIYISYIAECKDGSVSLILGGDDFYKINVGKDGKVSPKKKLADAAKPLFQSYMNVMRVEPGLVYSIYYSQDDYSKNYAAFYNVDTDEVSDVRELPSTFGSSWTYDTMALGLDKKLLFTTNNGINEYTIGDTDSKPRMNSINSDLCITRFFSIIETSPESFIGIYSEDWESGAKAAVFTYVKPEDIVDKKVITLAGIYIPYDLKKRVVEYNRNNQDYRIVMKTYEQYNNMENEYTGAVTQLNNDIVSGGMPDILYASNNLPVENYIAKGLVADIGKLIENDEELSKVEFLQNVFDAYSIDGTLYYVVPYFNLNTMIAKKSLVGNRSTWTMEDMKKVVAGMGEEASAFGEMTRDNFMNFAMYYCGSQFVDLATGKCNFNGADFIGIMEYAKTLPKEIVYDENSWNRDYQAQYRDNETLLMSCYIGDFRYLVQSIKGAFGDDFTYVGFPAETGKGSYIECYNSYVLSAKSANQDEAWNFVRYYLTEEYQKEQSMPVHKKLFEEKAKQTMDRPYWEDENGEKQYYDYTVYINGEEVILQPFTEAQMQELLSFMESVDRRSYADQEILKIIMEEVEAYFSGQKSAADVAAIIQSRAQMYVDTNR
ncbi:MAG: ABC transporter substrate-binding protein [Acetatifactor sp.]